jgi:hypothetical protein
MSFLSDPRLSSSQVIVKTTDIRGAGTDSNITICIHGTKDGANVDTGTHKLDDSKVRDCLCCEQARISLPYQAPLGAKTWNS